MNKSVALSNTDPVVAPQPAAMTATEIDAYSAERKPRGNPLIGARRAMQGLGLWHERQQLGRSWPVACVALEITQRCNLDCTLCYLSEHSEAVHDLPLPEVMRRLEGIRAHYGPGINLQITGGDPTLRKRSELLAIVARAAQLGLWPTLMTNGIKATRQLLTDLAEVGLADVAFHVDSTQQRRGYSNEIELNALRSEYLERTRGLPLSVMFNTTVHRGNFEQLPDLVEFFRDNARAIRTVSFQLQADTGRGIDGKREDSITIANTIRRINKGAGLDLNFDGFAIGHPRCNRYALCLAANGSLTDVFDQPALINRIQQASLSRVSWDRANQWRTAAAFSRWLVLHPRYLGPCLGWAGRKLWQLKRDLLAARGRITTLSFVIHNFMDANALEHERIDACVFKAMTGAGPLSMCMHNAKRDADILRPLALGTGVSKIFWHPLSGRTSKQAGSVTPQPSERVKPKHLKGRAKQRRLSALSDR